MRVFSKRSVILCVAVICGVVALAFIIFAVLNLGTVGLEYESYGDGTCYVSSIGRAVSSNVKIPVFSPNGELVTGIGSSAFEGYSKLKTIELHSGIRQIGADAFYGCDNLTYTKYGNAYYIGSEDAPYQILIKAASVEISECEIHPDTQVIYGSAFSGCTDLLSISIPAGVKSIGAYAFAWCDDLCEVSIGRGVEFIDEYAFLGCKSLKEIAVPRDVKQISNWAFAFCDELYIVSFADACRLETIGDYAFYGCESLNSFYFDRLDSLFGIGYAAFAGCSQMKQITAPRENVKICELAFLGCPIENDSLMIKYTIDEIGEYVKDKPENVGVLNTILKAKQLKNITFYAEKSIPKMNEDIKPGQLHSGMPYSSNRFENLFVPNFVSFYSFMTSTKNPNSYLYKIDIGELGNVNGDTYYGAVCSTYCNYALGIEGMYTTHQWVNIPDMQVLEHQNIDAMKLGDTILGNSHVLIVTGIDRDTAGKVYSITIMDIAQIGVRERVLTREKFEQTYSTDVYTYCRYARIAESDFDTTPFTVVYDKTPQTFNFNLDIIPRKGDKSNWLVGQHVEIDVFNTEDYKKVEIYRNGELIQIRGISEIVVLVGLKEGSYKARLVGEKATSDFCYWMVVDATSVASSSSLSKCVDVRFHSTNAQPAFIVWQEAKQHGVKHMQVLTQEQIDLGFAIGRYTSGNYKVRVAFKTEYGVIFSELSGEIAIK